MPGCRDPPVADILFRDRRPLKKYSELPGGSLGSEPGRWGLGRRKAVERLLERSGDRENPEAAALEALVTQTRTIAVVGLSRDPQKVARKIPSYLSAKGFEVIPVNPNADRILGRDAFAHLDDLEEPVDMVLVFRPSSDAAEVIRVAASRPERPMIWLQEGIRADDAAREAREAGSVVVQDLCLFTVHRAMGGETP